jgi:hypothetical protein
VANTKKAKVNRSVTIGVESLTVDSINEAVTKVGAPTSSTVSTGIDSLRTTDMEYSITFSWSEEI